MLGGYNFFSAILEILGGIVFSLTKILPFNTFLFCLDFVVSADYGEAKR